MWSVTCGDGRSVNSQPDLSCSPAVGAVPLRRRQQRGHRHRRQGGCSAPAGARPSGCQDMRGRQSGLWPWASAPHSPLNMHQLHAGHWSGSGHNNISAGSERTPPRNASSAQNNSRFAGRCIVCREEEGTKRRVILRCSAPRRVMGRRLLRLGTILPSPQEDRDLGGRSVHHLLANVKRFLSCILIDLT